MCFETQDYFKGIMTTLGLDLSDDSLKGTPYRFAKMYVKELFAGLDPKNKPSTSVFENKYDAKQREDKHWHEVVKKKRLVRKLRLIGLIFCMKLPTE